MRNTFILCYYNMTWKLAPSCEASRSVEQCRGSLRPLEGNVEGVEREAVLHADGVVLARPFPGRQPSSLTCHGQGARD